MTKKIHALHRDLNEKFKQRVEAHYAQVKEFRSKYANTRIIIFAFLLILYLGLLYAHEWTTFTLPAPLIRSSTLILTILITFTVSSIIVRLLESRFFSFFENEIEIEKRLFYTKLFSFVVYLFAILYSLRSLGVSFSNLTLVAGLITTAFALSMRDVLASYMAWMVLLFKRPFRIGDFIKIGDDEGQVEHIGTFFVTIDDGTDNPMRAVKVPTQLFLSRTVTSYGVGDVPETLRIRLHSLPADIEARLESILKAVKEVTGYHHTLVTLDTDAEFVVLIISYETQFVDRKQVKTKVLARVLALVEDVRKITK